jgi:phage shock protein PspC (stress-responsive transcriptional regulator)
MNKTITSNIGGIIFNIEEDAYEKLSLYLARIRQYLANAEGRDEILADVEARIAEMLQMRVSQSKQAVLMEDVDLVMDQMGSPEAFAEGGAEGTATAEEQKSREQFQGQRTRRRLYRDADDNVIGGVCSGLGYYFDIDPVWIRGAFAISFFVFGTGLLFYILLMIIIPKAESTAEKLEMKGESVNFDNIRRTVQEEFEHLKKKAENFGEEAKQWGKRGGENMRSRGSRIEDNARDVVRRMAEVFGKLFALLFIVLGVSLLISFILSLFGFHSFSGDVFSYARFSMFNNEGSYLLAVISGILIIGIPCVMMIYKGIRMLLKVEYKNRYVHFTAWSLWLVGIFMFVWLVIDRGREFSEEDSVTEAVALLHPEKDTLLLKVNIDPEMASHGRSRFRKYQVHNEDWRDIVVNGKAVKLGYPRLTILPSENGKTVLEIEKISNGPDRKTAIDYARKITYNVTQMDSVIEFSSYFKPGDGDPWRGQQVIATLYLPVGKVVSLHRTTKDILWDIDNVTDTWDGDMVNRRWKMTPQGLVCVDCIGIDMSKVNDDLKNYNPATKTDSVLQQPK